MQHENCIVAIAKMQDKTNANVHSKKENCKCPHEPTPCDWSGNSMYFACLNDSGMSAPQKVYSTMNSGGHGKIIVEEGRTGK